MLSMKGRNGCMFCLKCFPTNIIKDNAKYIMSLLKKYNYHRNRIHTMFQEESMSYSEYRGIICTHYQNYLPTIHLCIMLHIYYHFLNINLLKIKYCILYRKWMISLCTHHKFHHRAGISNYWYLAKSV
jgi:hypothetical protein